MSGPGGGWKSQLDPWYPALDELLGGPPNPAAVSTWTSLGAALTILAAQAQAATYDRATAEINAGPAAFAVLSAVDGGCDTQLNLLLLVAADSFSANSALATQQRRAEEACPGEVTAGWLIGQAQLRLFTEGQYPEQSTMPTADAVASMRGLVDRHPHDVAGLTGLGDAYLAAAMSRNGSPPFTTRRYFQQAVAAYSRAVDQGGRPFAAVGLARALTGLREPQRAIELLTPLAQPMTRRGLCWRSSSRRRKPPVASPTRSAPRIDWLT